MILIQFPGQQICLCFNTASETCSQAKEKPCLGRALLSRVRGWCSAGATSGDTFPITYSISTSFPTGLVSSQGKPLVLDSAAFSVFQSHRCLLTTFSSLAFPLHSGRSYRSLSVSLVQASYLLPDFSDLLSSFGCMPVKASKPTKVYFTQHFKESYSSKYL